MTSPPRTSPGSRTPLVIEQFEPMEQLTKI
jgi:hypothetical protein